jgi:hypothetical protein
MDPEDLEPEDILEPDVLDPEIDETEDLGGEEPAEGSGVPGEDEPLQPRRQPGRAERAVIEAKRARQESDARAERLERQLEQLLAAQRAPQPDYAAQERERERLANMSYEERLDYEVQRARGDMSQAINSIRQELQLNQDAAKFESMCARNPLAAKFRDEVERMHAESAAKGQPVAREILLYLAAGKASVAKAPKAMSRAQRAAGEAIARNTTRGGAAGSDVRTSGRGDPNSLEAIEARLRNAILP